MSENAGHPQGAGAGRATVSDGDAAGVLGPAAEAQHTLARGTGIAVGGKLAGRGLYSASQILLAHALGPFEFGLWATGWTAVRLLTFFAGMGLDKGVVNFGARCWPHDRDGLERTWKRSLGWATGSAAALGLALYLEAPWVALRIFHQPQDLWVLRWFAPALPLGALLTVASAGTRVTRRMKYTALVEDLGQPFFLILFVAVCVLLHLHLAAVITATVASLAACAVLAVILLTRLHHSVPAGGPGMAPSHGGLLSYSAATMFTGLFGGLILWTDRIVLAMFRSPADVGVYQAISQAPLVLNAVVVGIAVMAAPFAALLDQHQERRQLRDLYRTMTRWGLFLALPPALIGIVGARDILTLLFGAPYAVGALAMSLSLSLMLLGCSLGPVGTILVMMGRQNVWLGICVIGLLLNVVICVALIPLYGIDGAAIAAGASAVMLAILGVMALMRTLGMAPLDGRYCAGLVLLTAAMASLVWLNAVGWGYWAAMAAAAGLLGATLWAVGFHQEDRAFLYTMRSALRGLSWGA